MRYSMLHIRLMLIANITEANSKEQQSKLAPLLCITMQLLRKTAAPWCLPWWSVNKPQLDVQHTAQHIKLTRSSGDLSPQRKEEEGVMPCPHMLESQPPDCSLEAGSAHKVLSGMLCVDPASKEHPGQQAARYHMLGDS